MPTLAEQWIATIEDFNRTGTFDAAYELMAEGFSMEAAAGSVVGRDAARAALEARRDATGWSHFEVLTSTEAEGWVTLVGRFTFAAGTTTGGSIVRFDDAGRVAALWTHADPLS